jgi:predicted enzyme related to lactoylglutathione lyase
LIAPASRRGKEKGMGQPVVHFEIVGKDVDKLQSYYSELFGWKIENFEGGPTRYGVVAREESLVKSA